MIGDRRGNRKFPRLAGRTAMVCALLGGALAPLATRSQVNAAALARGPVDPKMIDELAEDTARYAEAVRGFRTAASNVIRQTYFARMRAIRGKYEPLISLNEREEKDRRKDAIALFEEFLRKHPDDRRWTPDAMFRLAELYYEKSSDEFLTSQETYQKTLDENPSAAAPEPPRPDYANTIALYRRLLTEFPSYRLLDAAYYLLGFCLSEMGQEDEARQALLALTCANKYKPLDPPAKTPATQGTKGALADVYKECKPVRPESKFLPEAWTRVGEMHFDSGELAPAISAYQRVLAFKDSSYYDKALYKLAWSYYRDNRFPEAIREFDNLVKWADARKASGDKFGSDLRPEAVQYLGVSFSEPDWDGDTLPDGETGLARASAFYKGREEEPHVKEVFQRLGDIYFDSTKYPEAIAVYKALLEKWPYYTDAPHVQEKIVRSYERDRNLVAAAKEREALGRNYTQGSAWYEKNKDNPEALAIAQQLSEDALLTAATNVHAAAQACKGTNPTDPAKIAECKKMYATAAELYEKYLAAYPNSKRAYEFSAYYADALFYSGQLDKAIAAYTQVRDSNLDNRFQEDAAFRIVKAYEEIIEGMKAAKQFEEPPIPDESNTKPPVTPMPMPEVYAKYLGALDWYIANIKNDRIPELKYATAVMLLRYRNWPEARARLQEVATNYCGGSTDVGFKAYDALLKTYFIDFGVEDEELKDCALGRLLSAAEQFSESPCGKSPQAGPYLARINQIKSSVKSTVITKRLQLALENEEKGTDKQLTQCKEGGGGIALVTGTATPSGQPAAGGAQSSKKLSTEVDVGLALDLIDLVNAAPKDPDSPNNLNNACVIYERLFQFGEATKCYERLARDCPESTLAMDAVWNAARNHRRFFEFDQAVAGYLRVAEDPKFANYEHRKDALGIAAQLLDNDQQYAKAAQMYRRFADSVADKPGDSAQAFTFACADYEKMKDTAKHSQCLREFIKRYQNQKEAGEYVVGAYLKMAAIADQGKDRRAVLDAYKKVRDEYKQRGLPPATPAAAAAAKADFLLAEEKFKAFQAKPLKFGGKADQIKKTFDSFTAEAKSLAEEYQHIWDYKDATWTLASFLRTGDIYYEFAQKLVKAADNPPDDLKKLAKQACRANPDDCGVVETQYKDAIFGYVTPIEDEAKKRWKNTLERASQLGVTNEYVKKARENLSKYLPDEFPFIKDERIGLEAP